MSAIGGNSLGLITGYAILDQKTGEVKTLSEIFEASGGGDTVTSAEITDATTVGKAVLTAEDGAEARTAIGAGTSNLAIGTTSTTAKAGDYVPDWTDVANKPTTFAPVVGTTAATAMAGNKVPTGSERGGVLLQAAIADLTAAPTQADFNNLLAALRAAGVLTA